MQRQPDDHLPIPRNRRIHDNPTQLIQHPRDAAPSFQQRTWIGMLFMGKVRHVKGLKPLVNANSIYKRIERPARGFNLLVIPRNCRLCCLMHCISKTCSSFFPPFFLLMHEKVCKSSQKLQKPSPLPFPSFCRCVQTS